MFNLNKEDIMFIKLEDIAEEKIGVELKMTGVELKYKVYDGVDNVSNVYHITDSELAQEMSNEIYKAAKEKAESLLMEYVLYMKGKIHKEYMDLCKEMGE